jgi:hypothetical protein
MVGQLVSWSVGGWSVGGLVNSRGIEKKSFIHDTVKLSWEQYFFQMA